MDPPFSKLTSNAPIETPLPNGCIYRAIIMDLALPDLILTMPL